MECVASSVDTVPVIELAPAVRGAAPENDERRDVRLRSGDMLEVAPVWFVDNDCRLW
jgi:hypothetical protein